MYVPVLPLPQANNIQQCQLPDERDRHALISKRPLCHNEGWNTVIVNPGPTACKHTEVHQSFVFDFLLSFLFLEGSHCTGFLHGCVLEPPGLERNKTSQKGYGGIM